MDRYIEKSIKKYRFGTPFNTEAVCNNDDVIEVDCTQLPFFSVSENDDGGLSFAMKVSPNVLLFGLGEANRGINKRGYIYESNCTDDFNHTEDKISLYGAHNFLIIDNTMSNGIENSPVFSFPFGIFIDSPAKTRFDLCFTKYDEITITTSKNADVYIIINDTYINIVKAFRKIIGTSYIPPKWAFGYQQCRWSYMSADEIRDVVKQHRNNNIPLDAVYLDIDYMDNYKDFTTNNETFPDFEGFVSEMKEQNIHLVPIIDAGVKIEEGYDVYEEGVKNNYFCKDKDGNDFVACVWPGYTHFPDFMQPQVRKWFGDKYSVLIDKGIDGFWNDMNEPAIFHTPYGIQRAIEKFNEIDIDKVDSFDNSTVGKLFDLRYELNSVQNSPKDYALIYHNVNGEMICHTDIHNIYGYNMTRAAGEAMKENYPDKRMLLFSRSSYIGMHRYGGIWTGDNHSWWSHLLLNIKMMPSLNMCGFLYCGADIGGFGSNTSRELVLRWLAFGIFTPLMRNHSASGTRRQEFYQFENSQDFKDIIDIRYALIPYLYSEYVKAALKNEMYIRPMAFDYPEDKIAVSCEDQLLVGESIMIAPVYTQNATGRYVYLPDDMLYIRFQGWDKQETQIMKKGIHYINVALNEVPVFVKKNHILLLATPASNTSEIDTENLNAYGVMDDDIKELTYELYDDDGYSECSLKNIKQIVVKKEELN